MDPTDIFSLAQQAGMPGMDQTPADTVPFTESPFRNSPGFTDEDILAAFVPQSEGPALFQDEEQPLLTPPKATPTLSAPPTLPSLTASEGQKASASTSGFSQTKNDQIRRGPGSRLDARIANVQAEGQALEQQRQQRLVDAALGEKQAAEQELQATSNFITAEGHQKAILADLQQSYDTRTEELIAGQNAQAAEAKANYVAALNDFRAARVDPAQLWGNMSGGEQFGMLVTAFVQDFLGAKGIQTSAMTTFNRAVERNMDAQIRAIQTKGQVADGFKTLWDMQMAESNSMQEARARMRGFMIDSFKTSMEANLSQFNAALATSKGRAAIAKLDTELAKNLNEVSKHIDATTATRISQEIQRYGQELNASQEAARIAIEREKLQMQKDQMAGANAVDPRSGLIFDTSQSGQGFARWVFRDDIKQETKDEFLKKTADVDNITRLYREYQGLYRKFKNQSPLGGTRWQDTDTARLRNVMNEILSLKILERSGKAANEAEVARLKTGVPEAAFSTRFNIGQVLADTERRERDRWKATRKQLAYDLPENDARRKFKVEDTTLGEAEAKEAAAVGSGEGQRKTPEQLFRDNQVKYLERHSAFDRVEDVGSDVKKDHEAFVKENPDLFPTTTKTTRYRGETYKTQVSDKDSVFNYERGLTRLKGQAQRGLDLASEAKSADEKQQGETLYQENVELLKHVAAPVISGTNPNDREGRYAMKMLRDLGEDVSPVASESLEPTGTAARQELDPRLAPPSEPDSPEIESINPALLPPIPSKRKK